MRSIIWKTSGQVWLTDEPGGLADYQAIVRGMIDSAPCDIEGISVYINDEGKYLTPKRNTGVTNLCRSMLFDGDYIAGDVVIVGYDPHTGDSVDLTEDQVEDISRKTAREIRYPSPMDEEGLAYLANELLTCHRQTGLDLSLWDIPREFVEHVTGVRIPNALAVE